MTLLMQLPRTPPCEEVQKTFPAYKKELGAAAEEVEEEPGRGETGEETEDGGGARVRPGVRVRTGACYRQKPRVHCASMLVRTKEK